ncbi:hypothetical protein YTPLAS72_26470 [Nitrospira sp.]|nr:hypothetical protein YTPLAS72_26470 [Nitrospira sp.]
MLMTLTFFSSPTLAEAYHQEGNKKRTLAQLGRSIYRARLEAGDLHPEPARPTKIGRNDLCLCGSGKKFKKCCGGTGAGPVFH